MIVRIAIAIPTYHLFDYLLSSKDAAKIRKAFKGIRVKIPFGKRQLVGFIIDLVHQSAISLKNLKFVIAVLDETPLLPSTLVHLLEWMSRYYHAPLGEVFSNALPGYLKNISSKKSYTKSTQLAVAVIKNCSAQKCIFNEEQNIAFETIRNQLHQFKTFLLEGVTGSGKTEIYLQLMQEILEQGKQTLLLVPEISLAPQMLAHITARFPNVVLEFHSRLSEKIRRKNWEYIRNNQAKIVIGTRSALFLPLSSVGLIILDEEHDSSFKQQSGFRYHARDSAIMLAKLTNIPIILGSATPSLESLLNSEKGRYQKLVLSKRAGRALLPLIKILDIRHHHLSAGLSHEAIQVMKKHLTNKGQVILFLNRRGFSPLYLCHDCGWTVICPNCDSPLRLHQLPETLRCHYCDYTTCVPLFCNRCKQKQLFALGQGTQRLEQTLQQYFPHIRQVRIDSDSTRHYEALSQLLNSIPTEQPAILIGTQILAKGHHFPNVTLAIIVEGDMGLFAKDFRALEQTAQLIIQVAGRTGRASRTGTVMIQTHHPDHPVLRQLVEEGYGGFSRFALKGRQQSNWPPFTYVALLHAESKQKEAALNFLTLVKNQSYFETTNISVLGPVPALLTKRAGYYRARLLFCAKKRAILHDKLSILVKQLTHIEKKSVRYLLEVDPIEII